MIEVQYLMNYTFAEPSQLKLVVIADQVSSWHPHNNGNLRRVSPDESHHAFILATAVTALQCQLVFGKNQILMIGCVVVIAGGFDVFVWVIVVGGGGEWGAATQCVYTFTIQVVIIVIMIIVQYHCHCLMVLLLSNC